MVECYVGGDKMKEKSSNNCCCDCNKVDVCKHYVFLGEVRKSMIKEMERSMIEEEEKDQKDKIICCNDFIINTENCPFFN